MGGEVSSPPSLTILPKDRRVTSDGSQTRPHTVDICKCTVSCASKHFRNAHGCPMHAAVLEAQLEAT